MYYSILFNSFANWPITSIEDPFNYLIPGISCECVIRIDLFSLGPYINSVMTVFSVTKGQHSQIWFNLLNKDSIVIFLTLILNRDMHTISTPQSARDHA